MKAALLVFILAFSSGCVPECERRLGEQVKISGTKIQNTVKLPTETRKEGEKVARAMVVLQRRVIPNPETAVFGSDAEFERDLEQSAKYEDTLANIKSTFGGIVKSLADSNGVTGAAFAAITALLGGYAVWKRRALNLANTAIESRSRIADSYRELLTPEQQRAVEEKLGQLASKFGIPDEEITKWASWLMTPDKIR